MRTRRWPPVPEEPKLGNSNISGGQSPVKGGISIQLDDELFASTIHKNVGQDIIVITEDKLKLRLIEQQNVWTQRRDWITPGSLFLAMLGTLWTNNFKTFLGIPAEVWMALYIVLAVGSGTWLVIALFRAYKSRGKGGIDDFVSRVKSNQ